MARVRSVALLVAAAVGLCALTGCTSLGRRAKGPFHFAGLYLQDRFEDMMEVVDLGLTITPRPSFALYGAFASLTPLGAAYMDSYFVGIGGGQILGLGAGRFLVTRHYLAAGGGLVWGYEEVGWQEYDTDDLSTFHCQDVGPAALVLPPHGRPGPVPTCRHYFHVVYVGLLGNLNFFESLDFLLGIVGFDICGDDGVRLGKWPWQTEDDAAGDAYDFYDYHRGFER